MAQPLSPAGPGGSPEQQLIFWICVCLNVTFLASGVLLSNGVVAPYGRYNSSEAGTGLVRRLLTRYGSIHPKAAWVLQECPTLIAATVSWVYGDPACKGSLGNMVVLACFIAHYVNRTIIYPFRMQGSKPIPFTVMLMAMAFCSLNGFIQCFSLTRLLVLPASAATLPLGVALWALGLYINLDADDRLRSLRKPGETGYKIPKGGMFTYVSGANFFGEILEWTGFAVAMGGALPGLTFAFCTACNIGPRALEHHRWYLDKFKDEYPKERRALIPFLL